MTQTVRSYAQCHMQNWKIREVWKMLCHKISQSVHQSVNPPIHLSISLSIHSSIPITPFLFLLYLLWEPFSTRNHGITFQFDHILSGKLQGFIGSNHRFQFSLLSAPVRTYLLKSSVLTSPLFNFSHTLYPLVCLPACIVSLALFSSSFALPSLLVPLLSSKLPWHFPLFSPSSLAFGCILLLNAQAQRQVQTKRRRERKRKRERKNRQI